MTPEDIIHVRAIRRAAAGGAEHFSGFTEVRGPHYRGAYHGELFRVYVPQVIEAVHRALGDAQSLPGANLDRSAINSPRKYTLDTVENLFVGVITVRWSRQPLPGRHRKLKD